MITNETTGKIYLSKEEKAGFTNFWSTESDTTINPLISKQVTFQVTGEHLKTIIQDGMIYDSQLNCTFAVHWASFPSVCFKSPSVLIRFRIPIKNTALFPVALILANGPKT